MNKKALLYLRAADPKLDRLIDQVGRCLLSARRDESFPALMRSIVYQQLSGKAAETIHLRVLALFAPHPHPTPRQVLQMPDEQFRSAGLSGGKTRYIKDLALHSENKTIPTLKKCDKLSDEQLIEVFTQVQGVGTWSVQMFLMFNLGRPDVWPVTDLGIRKGFALLHGLDELPDPREMANAVEHWRPYRSIASWYLWRSLD